jgi:enoyl-CoA hydratase/carnithine racemase
LDVPVIGALRGPAIGAGACLAIAACDLRVAEPSTKIAFNFLKIGLHPGKRVTFLTLSLVVNGHPNSFTSLVDIFYQSAVLPTNKLL